MQALPWSDLEACEPFADKLFFFWPSLQQIKYVTRQRKKTCLSGLTTALILIQTNGIASPQDALFNPRI